MIYGSFYHFTNFIICLLLVTERAVLNSLTVFVNLSLLILSISLYIFWDHFLRNVQSLNGYIFLVNWSFYQYKVTPFPLITLFALKTILHAIINVVFLLLCIPMVYFYHPFPFNFFFFQSSLEDMFVNFRERERGGGETEKEREKHQCERENSDRLPPVRSPAGDQTQNLGVHPDPGWNPQSFWCTGRHFNNWATCPGSF